MADGFNLAAAVDYDQNTSDTKYETNKRTLEVDSDDQVTYKKANYSGEFVFSLLKLLFFTAFQIRVRNRMCYEGAFR